MGPRKRPTQRQSGKPHNGMGPATRKSQNGIDILVAVLSVAYALYCNNLFLVIRTSDVYCTCWWMTVIDVPYIYVSYQRDFSGPRASAGMQSKPRLSLSMWTFALFDRYFLNNKSWPIVSGKPSTPDTQTGIEDRKTFYVHPRDTVAGSVCCNLQ